MNLKAIKNEGSEDAKLSAEIKLDCDMQFAANVFLQLFKQSEDLYHAAMLAMIISKVGSGGLNELIDGLYNEDVTEKQFDELLKENYNSKMQFGKGGRT